MKRLAVFLCALMLIHEATAASFVMPQEMKACRIWSVPIDASFVHNFLATEAPGPSGGPIPALPVRAGNVAFTNVNSAVATIDSPSMQVLQISVNYRDFSPRAKDGRLYLNSDRRAFLESEALAVLNLHLTTGRGSAECIATGTESSLVGDQLRSYLESEVQKTIKASVDAQMITFLDALKKANDADRSALIDRALLELPKNASLLEALRGAMQANGP